MVSFSWVSAEQRRFEQDLVYIQNHISNPLQFALFDKRARKLFDRNHWTDWIPTREAKVLRLLAVIWAVRLEIETLPLGHGNAPNIEHHNQLCEILKRGMENLNAQAKRSDSRVKKDETRELEAIQLDLGEIEEAVRLHVSLAPSTTNEIQIYRMDSPRESPLLIAEDYSYYNEVAWHLHQRGIVSQPELWRRLRTQHEMTAHGYKWKFAKGHKRIQSQELDVVNMEYRRSESYIVALAHDKDNGEEIPVPMDVVNFYDVDNESKRCCDPFCGNLRRHLQIQWPDRYVICARFLESPSESVIDKAFDTSQFPPRTNTLYLQWRPKSASS